MSSEKKMILQMLKDGKIDVDQAEKLLCALQEPESTQTAGQASASAESSGQATASVATSGQTTAVADKTAGADTPPSGKSGVLRIEVISNDGENVMVSVPLMLAKFAAKMIPAGKLNGVEANGVDLDHIINNIESFMDMEGKDIVNVESASGERVRIYIQR